MTRGKLEGFMRCPRRIRWPRRGVDFLHRAGDLTSALDARFKKLVYL